MPAALLAGSFGLRDPGEEAILAALMRALPGWEPVVASHDPADTAAEHGCEAIPIAGGISVARAVGNADAAVVAGGMLEGFGERSESAATASLGRVYALLSGARTLGKPTALVGVGSGRLRSRRRRALARALVRKADLFVLRDGVSASTLSEAGAAAPFRVGADPAWTLFERDVADVAGGPDGASVRGPASRPRRRTSDAVVVVLDRDACDEALAAALAAALDRLRAAGVEVRLQPWRVAEGEPDDLRLAGAVASRLGGPVEVLEPPEGLAEAGSSFSDAGLVLALRRHTAIAAAIGGVPSLAIAHEPGLADLARRLGQPWIAATSEPDELAAAIRDALDHQAPSRSAIRGQVASAEEGFKLLRLLLSHGDSDEANDLTGLRLEPRAA